VRGRGDSPVDPSTLRRLVAAVDPTVAILEPKTLQQHLGNQLRPQRTASAWIGTFGVIALLLAAIGLYGVVAQSVIQRRRELAVRCALGASPRGVIALVLGDGMRLVAFGAVVGGVGALGAYRVLQSLFTGLQPVDMRSTAAAPALLAIGMLIASGLPAFRAARLDPVEALRVD
jgi:ABC-type antimicrobial peptide transport system permease subunit